MSLAFAAMMFAREVHKDQKRRYTGNPYADHLAEVAGIAMAVGWHARQIPAEVVLATCWLHDCMEDQGISHDTLFDRFGMHVADGVRWLSDLEKEGNRAARKAASRERLAQAPHWVQTIKCADLISNTSSIVEHDPKFAVTYLEEKRLLLDVLTRADARLRAVAMAQCVESLRTLQVPAGKQGAGAGGEPPIMRLPVRDTITTP